MKKSPNYCCKIKSLFTGIKKNCILSEMADYCREKELLLVSLPYITFILLLISKLRSYIRENFEDPLASYLLAFVTLLESTSISWELKVVTDHYGLPLYFFLLLLLQLWYGLTRGDVKNSAESIIEEALFEELSVGEAIMILLAQVAGGITGHFVAKSFWWLNLTKEHSMRRCKTCMAGPRVKMLAGMIIEGLGVAINTIAARGFMEMNLIPGVFLKIFVLIYTIFTAMDYTGGYFSPSVATSMHFHCEGFTNKILEHFVVYWGGPILGSLSATYLFENIL